MEAYKFETTIHKHGIIKIPEVAKFAERPVEIFIVIKPFEEQQEPRQFTMDDFLQKWSGCLAGENPDQLKLDYLQKKYA